MLEAHEQGEGSLRELARRFRVSEAWAFKISSTRSRTGKMERPPGARRGRKSRITAQAIEYLQSRVKKAPDRTLAELQEDLRSQQSIEIGITRLWTVLRQMGLRLKKSHSTLPSGIRSGSGRSASSGSGKRGTSTRRSSSSWTKAASQRK